MKIIREQKILIEADDDDRITGDQPKDDGYTISGNRKVDLSRSKSDAEKQFNDLELSIKDAKFNKNGEVKYSGNQIAKIREKQADIVYSELDKLVTSPQGKDAISDYLTTDDKLINFVKAFKWDNMNSNNKFIQLLNSKIDIQNEQTFVKLYNAYCDGDFDNINFNKMGAGDEVLKAMSNRNDVTYDRRKSNPENVVNDIINKSGTDGLQRVVAVAQKRLNGINNK